MKTTHSFGVLMKPMKVFKFMNTFHAEYHIFSNKIKFAQQLESITPTYSGAYLSLSEKEMAYFSRVDPVPAREVANHMKLV